MRRWVDPLQTRAEGWTILVRLMVGLVVFFPEGIQKLVFPEILGAGHDLWIFHAPKIAHYGFWSMAHETRDDFLMLLGSLYLLIAGAGRWSVDAALARHATPSPDASGFQPTRRSP